MKTLFLLLTAGSPIVFGQSYDSWRGDTFWGTQLFCQNGEALVGACSSGRNPDCRQGGRTGLTHKIRCVNPPTNNLPWTSTENQNTIRIDRWGEWAFCGDNQVAVARCSSGENMDCSGAVHQLTCAAVSFTAQVRLDAQDTKYVCVSWGVDAMCPVGYVVTGSCGGGENPDCGTNLCSGKSDVWTGLKCTRARSYTYDSVGDATVAAPATFSFDGLCKAETYELEGEGSDRAVKQSYTFATSSSLDIIEELVVEQGSSLTRGLSVTNQVSAEVGFPKIGLGAKASTTVEAKIERTTTFDRSDTYRKQLTEKEQRESTVVWDYTLQGGLTWTLASWTARVSTFGDYKLLYREYTPGRTNYDVVSEEVIMAAGTLDERSFTLVLNSDHHDVDFLRQSSCTDIATQYMLGIGEFSDLTPTTQVGELVETGTSQQEQGNTGAPTATPNSDDNESAAITPLTGVASVVTTAVAMAIAIFL